MRQTCDTSLKKKKIAKKTQQHEARRSSVTLILGRTCTKASEREREREREREGERERGREGERERERGIEREAES